MVSSYGLHGKHVLCLQPHHQCIAKLFRQITHTEPGTLPNQPTLDLTLSPYIPPDLCRGEPHPMDNQHLLLRRRSHFRRIYENANHPPKTTHQPPPLRNALGLQGLLLRYKSVEHRPQHGSYQVFDLYPHTRITNLRRHREETMGSQQRPLHPPSHLHRRTAQDVHLALAERGSGGAGSVAGSP